MKNPVMKRIVWSVGATVALCSFYTLSCPNILGSWHGMLRWPLVMLAFGLIAVFIATLTFSRKVMIFIPVGYIVSFLIAWLCSTNGTDLYGAQTNNGWILWTITFLVFILVGIVWEFAGKGTVNADKLW